MPKQTDKINTGYDQTSRVYSIDSDAPTIPTPAGGGHIPMVEIKKTQYGNIGGASAGYLKFKTNTQIRRLTPIECERLQGFPDGWTKYGKDENGNVIEISETQRYKMMGNAVSVPMPRIIAERLKVTESVDNDR